MKIYGLMGCPCKLYAHQAAITWTTQPSVPADPLHENPVTTSKLFR